MQHYDDIDFLVQQTLNPSAQFERTQEFEDFNQDVEDLSGTGILYRVSRAGSTFVIKGIVIEQASEELQDCFAHFENYPQLGIQEREELVELDFFPTHNLELAKTLLSRFKGKRFPVDEANLLNISDPGHTWWLKVNETSLEIYFALSCTDQLNQLQKIGPLADSAHVVKCFQKYSKVFQNYFGPLSVSNSRHKMELAFSNREQINELLHILRFGKISAGLSQTLKLDLQTASGLEKVNLMSCQHFIEDLALAREFWAQVECKLY